MCPGHDGGLRLTSTPRQQAHFFDAFSVSVAISVWGSAMTLSGARTAGGRRPTRRRFR